MDQLVLLVSLNVIHVQIQPIVILAVVVINYYITMMDVYLIVIMRKQ